MDKLHLGRVLRCLLVWGVCALGYACSGVVPEHAYWPYGVEPPPPSYVNVKPLAPISYHFEPDIQSVCETIFQGGADYRACTLPTANSCDVYLPDQGEPGYLAALTAHEDCHCKGLVHGPDGTGWYIGTLVAGAWVLGRQITS